MIINDADYEDDFLEVIPYDYLSRIELNIVNDNSVNYLELSKEKTIKLRDELTRLIKEME